jgi:hypothetical protein
VLDLVLLLYPDGEKQRKNASTSFFGPKCRMEMAVTEGVKTAVKVLR